MTFIIHGDPIGKPRMTQRDTFRVRPCVARYRLWADVARLTAFDRNVKMTLTKPTIVRVRAYFAWTSTGHRVGPHLVKPDGDNILKAVLDALFTNDQLVYAQSITKLWADGGKSRVEVDVI